MRARPAARKRATSEFSRERMIERYDAVLRETVESYRAARADQEVTAPGSRRER
ncbi:MAG: hypothetical protein V3T08_06195 [Gemmatimonadota bacterium]